MRRISTLLAATTLTMFPISITGFGAEYPFNGFYTDAGGGLSFEVAQQKCALTFFTQHADGSGFYYVLDIEKFLNNKNISYIKTNEYSCKYRATTKTDTCTYAGKNAQGETAPKFFNYYDKITPTLVTGFFFADQKQLDSFIRNQKKPDASTVKLVFARCLDFSSKIMSKYTSHEANPFSPDKTVELYTPDMSAQSGNREIADRVLQQIKSDQ